MPSVNGIPVISATLHLPRYGQWVCRAQLDDPGDGSFGQLLAEGVATLSMDTRVFAVSDSVVGRIDPSQSQTFGLMGSCVFTAGRGVRLSHEIQERAYHDESGVTVATVLDDIIKDTQHTLAGTVTTRLQNKHFLRERGPTSRALTALLGKRWNFDLAGNLLPQLSNTDFPQFDLVSYDAVNQRCTLALNNLKDPRGCKIPELGKVVEACAITIDKVGIRAECELGELSLTNVIESIVEAVIARKVLAPEYYRVHSMSGGGRVNLQPFESSAGLPDLINVPMYAGVAGASVELNAGQTVLVQWVGNDRTKPIITSYVGDGSEHVSASIVINNSDAVAARVADPVSAGPLPGQTVTFGAPGAVGPMTQGTPYPFTFAMAVPIPGKDPTKLSGEIVSSTSTVSL